MRSFSFFAFILIVCLGFLSCGSESSNIGNIGGGTPGLATGVLLDNQDNPIYGASVWTEGGHAHAFILGDGYLAHTEFEFCPEPGGEIEHGGCSNEDGAYAIDCDGVGFFPINLMNNAGDPLPGIFGDCGGLTQTHPLNVGPQPTPTPSPTPSPTPTPAPN